MKLLVLGFALAALAGQAPPPTRGPVEGADRVAVLLADSGAIARARVMQVLEAWGYQLLPYDAVTRQLGTKAKQTPEGCSTSIQATVLGHTVLLSASSWCQLQHYHPQPVHYSAHRQVPFANFDCYA
ncbi:hypothetical protein GO988_23040 [Hymenobacter sp. HMF4947]|uniref:Uncharacterized protein n=1 Tax=Hymenobacter ginkgonis TaxID=2682976 RepID=A0A7K1TLC2_9BACT|nr:hypothetical protein [Hymenobacter ginkgonis]MVN79218.1 hypothetical protein [Hymenobacter ginkgonis]